VSDISWTRKINHPSEVLKKGDEVEAVVLEVDRPNQRIALGMKQLAQDPWEKIDQLYKVGDLVTGNVTKLASFGAFVGLQHDIDGLVHISQISEERVDKIKNVLKVGQEVTARVVKIDKGERRIGPRRAQTRRRPRGAATRLRRRRRSKAGRAQTGINLRNFKSEIRSGGLETARLILLVGRALRARRNPDTFLQTAGRGLPALPLFLQ
jgi:predicted RNA-binding protein with RPS1 domain